MQRTLKTEWTAISTRRKQGPLVVRIRAGVDQKLKSVVWPTVPADHNNKLWLNSLTAVEQKLQGIEQGRWQDLVRRSHNGERKAFELLLTDFAIALETAYTNALPAEQVQNAVEAALLRISKKLSTCNPQEPVLPWLLAVAEYSYRHLPHR